MASVTTTLSYNASTVNTTYTTGPSPAPTYPPAPGLLSTADGRVVLAFLVLLVLLVLALPPVLYVIWKRYCWVKV